MMKMNCQTPYPTEMMKRSSSVVRAVVLLTTICLGFSINAQEEGCIPEKPSASTPASKAYVYDFKGSLSASDEAQLNANFRNFRTSTSNEIILIAPDSMCGLDVWDYGVRIGNDWNVGQAEFDNGLVIVYKAKTSDSRGGIAVATGRGLEGAVPDGAAKLIIDKEMIPLFKKGQILQGITKGVAVFEDLLREEYNFSEYKNKNKTKDYSIYGPLIIFGLFFIFWLIQVGMYARTNKISFWKAMVILSKTRGTHRGRWGGFSGGTGGFGGYRGGGGSGGGGFGGFGGGSFGGGGASGSW
ncbi:MAG TPA: hypothetical protein DHU89_00470 [Flavobacteriales bacterium]|nr:hypothetical protein [Flavobacteriales bacterium]